MRIHRPAAERGHVHAGWLDSRHTFSFGQYHDPRWMGFGPLRVINEDIVAPGTGFPPHRHANMEILSYVLSGALAHRDSTALRHAQGERPQVVRAGELQWMGAGHGIEHSEYNASATEPVHFLQIWIQPDRVNAAPGHAQRAFDLDAQQGQWVLLASPDGAEGSLTMRQQAWLHGARLAPGERVACTLDPARRYWLHVVRGAATVGDEVVSAGSALGIVGEDGELSMAAVPASASTELLLFDLPHDA